MEEKYKRDIKRPDFLGEENKFDVAFFKNCRFLF